MSELLVRPIDRYFNQFGLVNWLTISLTLITIFRQFGHNNNLRGEKCAASSN